MRSPWDEHWQRKLHDRITELGFDTVEAFVLARETKTFEQMARELAPDIAPVQVEMIYLQECRAAGRLLEAAAECLARTIVERFPRGWGVGVRLDYRTASALAAWISDMRHDVDQSELDDSVLNAIADALQKTDSPPKGWLPKSGKDPFIQQAFRMGLRKNERWQ